MKSIPKVFLIITLLFISFESISQTKYWLNAANFTKAVSFNSALIKINDSIATYEDVMKLDDTSLLKIEFYNKKAAAKVLGKSEGKNGAILLTTKTYQPLGYTSITMNDSIKYFIMEDDTVFIKASTDATIRENGIYTSWNKFLEKNLEAQAPADNGAPPGLYCVTVRFFVNIDGSVSNIKLDQDPGYGTGQEVLRLMSKSPAWQPAIYNGVPVKSFEKQMIKFAVSEM